MDDYDEFSRAELIEMLEARNRDVIRERHEKLDYIKLAEKQADELDLMRSTHIKKKDIELMNIEQLHKLAMSKEPSKKYPALAFLVEHQNVDDIDLLDRDPHMYPWRYTLHGYEENGRVLIWSHAENLKNEEVMGLDVIETLVDAANLDAWIDDHIANINGVSAHPCKNAEYMCDDCECEKLRQQIEDISGEHSRGIVEAARHRFLSADPDRLLNSVRAQLIIEAQDSTIAGLQEQNRMLKQIRWPTPLGEKICLTS